MIKSIHIDVYGNAVRVFALDDKANLVQREVYPINDPHQAWNVIGYWKFEKILLVEMKHLSVQLNYHGDYEWDFEENQLKTYTTHV